MLKYNPLAVRSKVGSVSKVTSGVRKAALYLVALLVLVGSPLFQLNTLGNGSTISGWWYRASGASQAIDWLNQGYIRRSGDTFVQQSGVLLSSGGYWLWGDCPAYKGTIVIKLKYPSQTPYARVPEGYYVSRITVEFYDKSSYSLYWVKGPKLEVEETGQQFFLNRYRRNGYYKRTVWISSHPYALSTTIKITACGYDEVLIKRMTLKFKRWDAWAGMEDLTIAFGKSYFFRHSRTEPLSQGSILDIRSQGSKLVAYSPDPLIKTLKAEVFSLDGLKVLEAQCSGNRLEVTRDAQRTLANGVYLVVVTVKHVDGSIHREVRRIVIMR